MAEKEKDKGVAAVAIMAAVLVSFLLGLAAGAGLTYKFVKSRIDVIPDIVPDIPYQPHKPRRPWKPDAP